MSNSALVSFTQISPNRTSPRVDKIRKITIHHVAGNATVETLGGIFAPAERRASANYGIGTDGRVGMYVEEKDRAWTSGNAENDNQAVTIEVSNDGGAPDWHVSDSALASLIELCADICRRNGIERLNFTGDKSGNLTYHAMFQTTACPGPYLKSKMQYIADSVNAKIAPKPEEKSDILYRVQVGAYRGKANAEKAAEKLRAEGFTTCTVYAGGWWKLQVGAFSVKENAEAMLAKVKATGRGAFITTEAGETPPAESVSEAKAVTVGATVRLKKGAKDYDGKVLASFVYDRDHVVKKIEGDRAVIAYGGVTVAAVKVGDLEVG